MYIPVPRLFVHLLFLEKECHDPSALNSISSLGALLQTSLKLITYEIQGQKPNGTLLLKYEAYSSIIKSSDGAGLSHTGHTHSTLL
jgi:hypothetical protein